MTPKSTKIRPKRHSGLIVFLLHFWHRFLAKNGSKMGPQNGAPSSFLVTFLGFLFHMRLFWPQGSILESCWPHFEAPGLHFGVILGHILAPKGSNLEPCASDICSFRFSPFHKNILRLILSFLSVLKNILHIAPTPTPKTFKNGYPTRLSQKLPYHKGAAVSRSVLR